jgi:hypothetical protein
MKTPPSTGINPYGFIPIPKAEPERNRRNAAEELADGPTGAIDCPLAIEPPTFIPNTTKKFFKGVMYKNKTAPHPVEEFYSYEDLSPMHAHDGLRALALPIIPGSELKGMPRNAYEQLANSCFLEAGENNPPNKRTPLPKIAALLKKEGVGERLMDAAAQILEHAAPPVGGGRDAPRHPRLNAGGKRLEWFGKGREGANAPAIRNAMPIIGSGKALPGDPAAAQTCAQAKP